MQTLLILWVTISHGQVAPDPSVAGPYLVGGRTVDFVDQSRGGRLLKTEIWYPTEATEPLPPPRYPSGAKTRAIRNAEVAKGKFPLLLFSHGLMAVREQSTFLTEHLASHGFIVVACDHQYNTLRDFRPNQVYQSAVDRPRDLSYLLDEMGKWTRDPKNAFAGRLRLDQVGALGHSFGGYTVLAIGGAEVNATKPFVADPPPEKIIRFFDERVRAVVAYAPVRAPAFSQAGLAKCKTPTLIFGGTEDDVTPYADNQLKTFEHLSGPCYLASIRGGTHYTFNNEELTGFLKPLLRLQTQIDRERSDAMILRTTIAFLDRHLLGKDRFAMYLADDPQGLTVQKRN